MHSCASESKVLLGCDRRCDKDDEEGEADDVGDGDHPGGPKLGQEPLEFRTSAYVVR